MLDKLQQTHKNDVRLVFKFYPLPGHPHADIAARAAVAAMSQGKFWEMHHALFTNQRHLEQTDLDSYAQGLGLEVSIDKGALKVISPIEGTPAAAAV